MTEEINKVKGDVPTEEPRMKIITNQN